MQILKDLYSLCMFRYQFEAPAGGLGIGLAFGIACRYMLRFMRYMNASIDQQVGLTLALAYLSYYVANSPAAVSGKLPSSQSCLCSIGLSGGHKQGFQLD